MTENTQFNYTEAFSRNLGWVSLNEQQTLKQKRVAIAGIGFGSAGNRKVLHCGLRPVRRGEYESAGWVHSVLI